MERVYILGKGKLIARSNYLVFQTFERNERRVQKIPIRNVEQIVCIGKIGFSPSSLQRILTNQLVVSFFSWREIFKGCLIPANFCFPYFQIEQTKAYLEKREEYAKSIVKGLKKSTTLCLKLHKNEIARNIQAKISSIEIDGNLKEILGKEARIWKLIYSYLKNFFFDFKGRNFNPPSDRLNCLISFGNALLYSQILIQCIKAGLNPKIGFLHEIEKDRNSLVLDLSEIFKPFLLLGLNFFLLLKKSLRAEHFEEKGGIVYLNKLGKLLYLSFFEKFLNQKFYHSCLKRNLSIYSLIEKEVSNFKKSLISKQKYEPLVGVC